MKKKIVFIIVCLLILVTIAGLIFYIHNYTDYFKTDKQIFYKYLIEKNEMLSVVEDIKIPNESKSYKANTDITYLYNYDNRIEKMTDDQIIKNLEDQIKSVESFKGLSANIQSKVDKNNKKAKHVITLKNENDEILTIDAVRDNEFYCIKPADILNTYVGFENNNLEELKSKVDIIPQNIDMPDKINMDSETYEDIFKLSNEEEKHIINTYKEILYNDISESCYTREKEQKVIIDENEYIANKNILLLNKKESKYVALKILNKLKEDDITLKAITQRIKTINCNSEYGKEEKLRELIQGYINQVQMMDETHGEYVRIEVYDCNGKTIKLDVTIDKEKMLQIDFVGDKTEKTVYIKQSFTKNNSPAIMYDFATSLLGANDITITTGKNSCKIEVVLYNIEETYERILKDKREMYSNQAKLNELVSNSENCEENDDEDELNKSETDSNQIVTKEDLEDIEKLYEKYKNEDHKLLKIGFDIEYVRNSDTNEEYTVHANVCNSKIGAKCKTKKEYTDELGDFENINSSNCVFLNKYTKEQISGVTKLISDRIRSIIDEKLR